MSKPIMEIRNLTKKFGGLTANNDISFDIREGQVLGLIGPNGAGKTTLFNCICGLLPLTSGTVTFCGETISGLPTHKIAHAGVARAFQVVKPFGNMTALENVMVGAFCNTSSYTEAQKVAMEALERVFLADRAHKKAKVLNLRERKNLEIAKALATKPKLLLLDEVMAGLTPPEVQEILQVIREINQSGVTIMLIEHIMEAVMNISDHVVVINFGQKIAEGKPADIAEDKQVIEAYFGVEDDEEEGGDIA